MPINSPTCSWFLNRLTYSSVRPEVTTHTPAKVRGMSVLGTALPSKNLELSSEIELAETERQKDKVGRPFPDVL